jgi:CheY-like chemotaxis protein
VNSQWNADLTREVCGKLSAEARDVAQDIADRVRKVIGPTTPLRVLVVDDVPDAADALAALLGLLGHEVRACYDGPTAVAAAEEFKPDVALLDLMMPGMTGLEVAAHLRSNARTRALFLVATTALGGIEDRARTAIAGFHAHLVKPVDTPTLVDTLGRYGAVIHPGRANISP